MQMALSANQRRRRGDKASDPEDFMPQWPAMRKPQPTAAQLEAKFNAWAGMHNASVAELARRSGSAPPATQQPPPAAAAG